MLGNKLNDACTDYTRQKHFKAIYRVLHKQIMHHEKESHTWNFTLQEEELFTDADLTDSKFEFVVQAWRIVHHLLEK